MAQKITLVAGIRSSAIGCHVVIRDATSGALRREGRALHAASQAEPRTDPHSAGTDVAPDAWWTALLAAIDDAGGFADVAAFAVTAPSVVVFLDADGVVIRTDASATPAQRRTARAALLDEIGADEFRRRTGIVPAESSAVVSARWLRDAHPEDAARVDAVTLAHDWLTWRLRGFGDGGDAPHGVRLEELATDRSEAGSTGFWNPRTGKYEHSLLNRALGHAAIKPRVMRPDGWGGETAKRPEHGIRTGRVMGVGTTIEAARLLALGARAGDAIVTVPCVGARTAETGAGAAAGAPTGAAPSADTASLRVLASEPEPFADDAGIVRVGCDATKWWMLHTEVTRPAAADQPTPDQEASGTQAAASAQAAAQVWAESEAKAWAESVAEALARFDGVQPPVSRIIVTTADASDHDSGRDGGRDSGRDGGDLDALVREISVREISARTGLPTVAAPVGDDGPAGAREPDPAADGAAAQAAWAQTRSLPAWPGVAAPETADTEAADTGAVSTAAVDVGTPA